MARIAGIDLPKDKRIEIGLTYIYGIGRKSAKDILEKAGVNPDTRVKDLTDAEEQKLRDVIDKLYRRGRSAPSDRSGHQAPQRDRLLPRHASSQGPACPRPAQQDQRPHPQGPQEDHRK